MIKVIQSMIYFGMYFILLMSLIEARSSSAADYSNSNQEVDTVEIQPQYEDIDNGYYDLPRRPSYQNLPLDKLQMLYGLGRRSAYLQYSPSIIGMENLYRTPESKRQVRYRQCYFNPISCFRK